MKSRQKMIHPGIRLMIHPMIRLRIRPRIHPISHRIIRTMIREKVQTIRRKSQTDPPLKMMTRTNQIPGTEAQMETTQNHRIMNPRAVRARLRINLSIQHRHCLGHHTAESFL